MENIQGPQAEKIRDMFGAIAEKYDCANDVLSAGIHHRWRKKVVDWSGASQGATVLDCATGTGDLAIEFAQVVGESGLVIGTDFCAEMIEPAPKKAEMKSCKVSFKVADVTDLPFEDNQFDITSISFGIRNVQDPFKGLSELLRVLRPGGHLMILEFGQPNLVGFKQLYNFYSRNILPTVGGWVTGQKEAYGYLQNSSSNFPCRENFVDFVKSAGPVASVNFTALTGGIAYIYKIKKSIN